MNISQQIQYYKDNIISLERQEQCSHDLYISEGEDTSTTGPTELYECCRKCDHYVLVGHLGHNGRVIYKEEDEKLARVKEKAKLLGLTDEEINTLKKL